MKKKFIITIILLAILALVIACFYNHFTIDTWYAILSDKTIRLNMTDDNIDKSYIVMVLNSP